MYRLSRITPIGRDLFGYHSTVYKHWPEITPTEVTASSHEAGAEGLILCDCTSNAITVNLPAVSGLQGQLYIIVKTDSTTNEITVDPDGSEEINGDTTLTIGHQWDAAHILCDGTQWVIV